MKSFAYVNATNEKDAVAALKTDGIALPLAGGQDLLARMKDYIDSPDRLVNVKNALENLPFLGYIQPLSAINPGKLVAQGYIPKTLESTVVRESDFKKGVTILPLTTQGQTLWLDAWSSFKAG